VLLIDDEAAASALVTAVPRQLPTSWSLQDIRD